MPSHETVVAIDAPPRVVWDVTRDIASWPDWSPTMDEITPHGPGPVAVGTTALVRQPKLRPTTWTVDEMTPDRSFVWHTSGRGYRMTAVHLFEPTATGTETVLRATVTGPLAPLLWALAGRTVRRYVEEEGAALKRRCEAAA